MNLCDLCLRRYSECMNEHENMPNIIYDNSEGTGDAVAECDWFMAKPRDNQMKKESLVELVISCLKEKRKSFIGNRKDKITSANAEGFCDGLDWAISTIKTLSEKTGAKEVKIDVEKLAIILKATDDKKIIDSGYHCSFKELAQAIAKAPPTLIKEE